MMKSILNVFAAFVIMFSFSLVVAASGPPATTSAGSTAIEAFDPAAVDASDSAGVAPVDSTKEHAFLKAVNQRIAFVLLENQKRIQIIRDCFADMSSHETCAKETHRVRENTRILYPRMKEMVAYQAVSQARYIEMLFWMFDQHLQSQLLGATPMNFLSEKGVPYLPALGQSLLGRPSVSVPNPIGHLIAMDDIPQISFTPYQIQEALISKRSGVNFFNDFADVCRKHAEVLPQYSEICDLMKLRYDFGKASFYFEPVNITRADYQRLKPYIDEMSLNAFNSLKFRARGPQTPQEEQQQRLIINNAAIFKTLNEKALKLEQNIFNIATMNPYVVLAEAANPTDSEFFDLFSKIYGMSQKSFKKHESLLNKIENGGVSRRKRLSVLEYGPIVTHVIENPSESMKALGYDIDWEAEIFNPLYQEHTKLELIHNGKILGGILLANAACLALPGIGKLIPEGASLVKALATARNFLRSKKSSLLCVPIIGVVTNLGFLGHSYTKYISVYHDIFLAVDDENYLRDMQNLSTAKMSLIVDLLTAPFIGITPSMAQELQHATGLKADTIKILMRQMDTAKSKAIH